MNLAFFVCTSYLLSIFSLQLRVNRLHLTDLNHFRDSSLHTVLWRSHIDRTGAKYLFHIPRGHHSTTSRVDVHEAMDPTEVPATLSEPLNLDALPAEILSNIYEQYFTGMDITFAGGRDSDDASDFDASDSDGTDTNDASDTDASGASGTDASLSNLWSVNKTQSTAARAAMLKHATVRLYSAGGMYGLLRNCHDIGGIRRLVVANTMVKFIVADRTLRALASLEYLKVSLGHYQFYDPDELDANNPSRTKYLISAVREKTPWTRRIINEIYEALLETDTGWIADLMSGRAFSSRSRKPSIGYEIRIWLGASRRFFATRKRFVLTADADFQLLRGIVDGRLVTIPQDPLDVTAAGARGSLRLLYDNTIPDTRLQDLAERGLGRQLTLWEGYYLLREQPKLHPDIHSLTHELFFGLKHGYYGFSLKEEACLQIVQQLEKELHPEMRLESLQQVRDLVKTFQDRIDQIHSPEGYIVSQGLNVFEGAFIDQAWRTRQNESVIALGTVLDVYGLIRPAIRLPAQGDLEIDQDEGTLWQCCYKALFGLSL